MLNSHTFFKLLIFLLLGVNYLISFEFGLFKNCAKIPKVAVVSFFLDILVNSGPEPLKISGVLFCVGKLEW